MLIETNIYYLDLFLDLFLDLRFQLVFAPLFFLHWNWRLPRPMKGAGNKAVLVTGCDSGMGHRMAKRFDELKMIVFAGCLLPDGPGAKSLKQSCSERLHIVPLDITKEENVKEAVAYVKANLPCGEKGLYCLVNNAGIFSYTDFDLMTMEMCEEVISVNLMGTIRMTKHFLPLIMEARGRVVTITSILARMCHPQTSVYAATKHALDGFFNSLRFELMDKGVHVATVEPGDFSRTTDIMQWTQKNLEKMWENLSAEEKKLKRHLYEKTKQKTTKQKLPPKEQEQNYKMLLDDVEDAMLAEEPYWRYVSAPTSKRIIYWFIRMLPEEFTFKLASSKEDKK